MSDLEIPIWRKSSDLGWKVSPASLNGIVTWRQRAQHLEQAEKENQRKTLPLYGTQFFLLGVFDQTNSEELSDLIHAAGSIAHNNVTKKTTHLVMGYKSKSAKKMTE